MTAAPKPAGKRAADKPAAARRARPKANKPHPRRTPAAHPVQREAGTLFQVMSEFVDGYEQMADVHPSVSIFGSARIGRGHPYYRHTEKIARTLSDAGFSVVSGGGPGLMEAANRGAQRGKSPSVGLNIILQNKHELPNAYQDISMHFQNFFVRNVMFVKYASAYIVMPGGYGTLSELTECLTLIQSGKARKIPTILVNSQFWSGLVDWWRETMLAAGTIHEGDLALFQVLDDPEDICAAIFDFYEHGEVDREGWPPEYLTQFPGGFPAAP